MQNQTYILDDSALAFSTNRTIHTQECPRPLRNTKIELGPEVQKKHLNQFMLKLKKSGYNQKFRTETLDSCLNAHEKMVEEDIKGTKPLYRSRDWNQEERKLLKLKKKYNWWNNDSQNIQFKSVLFVTPTPGGVLLKDMKKREEELNRNNPERIKFVEKGGRKIKDIISSTNPFEKTKCV